MDAVRRSLPFDSYKNLHMKHKSPAGFLFSSALLLCLSNTALADKTEDGSPNSGMHSVSVDMAGDNAHNRQSLANLSLTVGDYWWAHLGIGKNKSASTSANINDINATVVNPGIGVASQHWKFTLDYANRKDGDNFKQSDWTTSIGWHNEHFGAGIDGMKRSTESQTTVTGQAGYITRMVNESFDGNGVGLHVDVYVTERFDLFAGAMSYHYGDVSTNRPVLSQLLYLSSSGITREQALLDSTYHLGATYQFDPVAFTARYINDRALDATNVTRTTQLNAAIFIGKHWTLTPLLGSSDSDQTGRVTFGGLSLSYDW